MATRNVDTAIMYSIGVTEKGMKQAVALTKDLGASSKVTQTAVDTSMKAVAASYKMVEAIAVKADVAVAKSAVDASTVVNKALDAQIAKMREAGASYQAIAAKRLATDAELAASIKRTAAAEVEAMKAVEVQTARTMRQRLAGIGAAVGTFGKGAESFGHRASGLSVPLLGAAAVSIKQGVDFQSQMTLVQTQAGASAKEVGKLSAEVLKLAPTVGTGPIELAKALFPIESVGIRGAKAMELLRTAAEGAHVGHADLATTTDVLVGVMKTADLHTHGLAATMGALNAIVGGGKLKMDDLVQAITTGVLPGAKGLGLGLRDVGAALDVMTARGVPAIDAATRIKMLFVSLATGSKQASDALATIGLSHDKLATAMRGRKALRVRSRS